MRKPPKKLGGFFTPYECVDLTAAEVLPGHIVIKEIATILRGRRGGYALNSCLPSHTMTHGFAIVDLGVPIAGKSAFPWRWQRPTASVLNAADKSRQ